ncbi:MAG TPA: DUF1501 domain-containing protein [Chitinophagaceae bacterium]|nr:DUF1501 domain-containing protein [Chitinophagaceae bacterium]
MKRRDFLKYTVPAAAASAVIAGFPVRTLGMESPLIRALMNMMTETDHVLVLVQLNGGNDGLNMVIPIDTYTSYQAARSNVAIPQNRILSLNGKTGLHPAMTGIHNLFKDGKAAIVQSVGYPQPNFSHFRATDIFMSASDANQYINSGWMGRYLDHEYPGYPTNYPNSMVTDPLGIQIGSVTSLTFQGPQVSMGMSISDPTNFYNLINGIQDPVPNSPAGNELSYIRTVARQTQQYSDVIRDAALKVSQQSTYPNNNTLADQLKIVARLVKGGLKTRVYMVSIGGFDTHSVQVNSGDTTTGSHATLLQRVSDAIKAFMDDLKFLGVEKRVLGMTFSEFGRRIKSNSSLGTDHGAAAPVILFGEYVNAGVLGTNPVIPANANVNDNIPMQYDFRSIYASVMEKWFCVDNTTLQTVMLKNFQSLPVIKSNSCNSTLPDLSDKLIIKNYPNPFTGSTTISFVTEGGHTSVMIIDMLGRLLKTLVDQEYAGPGQYSILFNGEKLASGVYYARLQNGSIQQVRAMLKVR